MAGARSPSVALGTVPRRWHRHAMLSPCPWQTGEAVRVLLQRLRELQGERVEAYRLLEQ